VRIDRLKGQISRNRNRVSWNSPPRAFYFADGMPVIMPPSHTNVNGLGRHLCVGGLGNPVV
jgi:hypothetical protein